MALQLHKAVIFKHKLRLSLAIRWGSCFTSVYVSNIQYAWEQMSDGTSTSQARIFQTNITRECSSHMELILHKCVCYKHTSRVSATVIWHFYFTSVYVPDIHEAWVHLSYGSYNSQASMCQTCMRWCAAFRWHIYFKSVYVSNVQYYWVQPSWGTSTSHCYTFQNDITRECSCQMALIIHKFVCVK
jgi:hypothetical protein